LTRSAAPVSHAHLESAELWAYLERWLPASPASIVDIGCGAGESTWRLADSGYAALGIDPDAPRAPGFRRIGLERLEQHHAFDAAVAIRSLHHVHDLQAGIDALAAALRPGARLVVFEFAIEAVDERAERWCAEHGLRRPTTAASAPEVTPLAAVRAALERRFRELDAERVPYLAKEAGRADFEAVELEEISSGRLAAAGVRLAYDLG
jgi:SAM-dependent methyltransferase